MRNISYIRLGVLLKRSSKYTPPFVLVLRGVFCDFASSTTPNTIIRSKLRILRSVDYSIIIVVVSSASNYNV
jgi:hypothetical protein